MGYLSGASGLSVPWASLEGYGFRGLGASEFRGLGGFGFRV